MSGDDDGLGRLRWRCRRGTKELDLVLRRYLDTQWAGAPPAERADFERLLEAQDPELAGWLLGGAPAHDPALAALIGRIRALPAGSGR